MPPDLKIPDHSQPINIDLTQEQIMNTANALRKTRPAYGPMIEFYSQVFTAQAEASQTISLDPIVIEPDILALKFKNEMPLITPSQFKIEMNESKKLMETICGLAAAHAPNLSQAGETLAQCLKNPESQVDLKALFNALLDSRDISDMAILYKISPEALGFFGFTAMAPSIQACSAQLSVYLKENFVQSKGYCPVCGSLPNLAFLDESGKKQVSCSLCAHIWQTRRMGCLFCDAPPQKHQDYFFSNEEKEYRVYCCDHCRHYIKTVDLREMGRRFFPKLEQIATLHLDIKAKEQGYTPGDNSIGPYT
ncbi:MAG: formate dehydrogenase accessory protein FdhE [Desulfobacter sp.]|nr:MAG: formate dehydrogenase accessory protein FdhE [Desulfobacter sp.]